MNIPKTMVHQLHHQAERLEDRPAMWTKKNGSWQPTSWRQYAQRVKHFGMGLAELGFKAGDALVILGFNREEWVVGELAAMAMGGTAVGLYTTSSAEQLAYVIGHCEAPIALVENEGYLQKLSEVRAKLPKLREVVVMDAPQTRQPGTLSYEQVLGLGEAAGDAEYYARFDALTPEGLGTLIYTSGTTGHPKGVMLSHRNLAWTTRQLVNAVGLRDDEKMISYLPLSHIAEQVLTIHGPLMCGGQVYFAESFEKVPDALREVRPSFFFGVPRVWEKFKAKAEAGLDAQPPAKKRLIHWARNVTARWHALNLAGANAPFSLDAQYAAARRLVFKALKEKMGLDQVRMFATAAAPIGKDVLEFFASLDMVIRETYGQSEVTGPTSVSTPRATRLGMLGQALQGVEVKIADDGEILVRGENLCTGYYKDPAATAELLQNGWLHSGDVGELDADGYLRITGRKKEIIVTSGGKKTPPATLEGLLKSISPLGNALVIGDNRHYLTAVLALDPEKSPAMAAKHGWSGDLSTSPEFREWLTHQIETQVNAKVARFEAIKKFHLLPHDFTVEGGELTSTLKVRRKICEQKYKAQIDALYAERQS